VPYHDPYDGRVLLCTVEDCGVPCEGFLGGLWPLCDAHWKLFEKFRDANHEITDGVKLVFAFFRSLREQVPA
jgi:hypothetical protein